MGLQLDSGGVLYLCHPYCLTQWNHLSVQESYQEVHQGCTTLSNVDLGDCKSDIYVDCCVNHSYTENPGLFQLENMTGFMVEDAAQENTLPNMRSCHPIECSKCFATSFVTSLRA